ncbi:type I secretion system permease/ATPase [Thauera sinica]|uniref:Type I secretion system permease/ATPase n=1 Tax=Thauera sinica TaxID=2665146 RepID=A0ABW1AQL6_9RHOO|nr:type I secretion system permease/ATPase [Thauera sp. K11]ATE62229.1 type I secretion system permease/ATPase [Thauera sp. K11]
MKTPPFVRQSALGAALWGFRREFAVCMAFSVLVNLLMLTPTIYMLQIYDRVMVSRSSLTLVAVTLVMLFCFAAMAFAEWARARLLVRLGVCFDALLGVRVFQAGFRSSLNHGGRNPARTFSDLTSLRQFMTGNGLFAFMDAPWTPIYLAVLFMLHPMLGVLGVVFALLLAGLAWLSHRLTQKPVEAALEAGSQVGAFVHGKLRNAEAIEAMGMLGNLRQRWQARHRRHLALNARAADLGARMLALTKFLRYTLQSLTLGAGALLVIEGELTAGAMIAANVLMGRATQPLDQMVANWKPFLGARRAFRSLDALLAGHPAPAPGIGPGHDAPSGRVRIEHLTATAPGRAQPILKDLSADFGPGEVIAIVGPSGSGKSTLARALVGIWPHRGGRVLIDGEPIENRDREALGPHIGYLPQDIELFEGSIAENVARFGELDPAGVIRACERAGVHDMILRFAQGYDTQIGEAGGTLSGGQRQRLGLARALYGDPRIVVLDEPNSNLDDVGEAALGRAVEDLKQQGSTVFLITHRRGIVGSADRLLVMDDGAITHDGPPRQVLAELAAGTRAAPGGAVPQPA